MSRQLRIVLTGMAGLVVLVAGGAYYAEWVGVGAVYLLTLAVLSRGDATDPEFAFRHAVAVGIGAICVTAVVETLHQIHPWTGYADYSVLTDPLRWDGIRTEIVLPAIVASIVAFAAAKSRRQRLLASAVLVGVIAWVLFEPIVTSIPYDEHGVFTSPLDHVAYRLFNAVIELCVIGVLAGGPLSVLVGGVPRRVDDWLSADSRPERR